VRKEVAVSDVCTESGALVGTAGAGADPGAGATLEPSKDEPIGDAGGCAFSPAPDSRGRSLGLSLALLASVLAARRRVLPRCNNSSFLRRKLIEYRPGTFEPGASSEHSTNRAA
jgi:MYXO-CTERM domain-containing protein